MASPYLNITAVTAGQNNKEITINDSDLALEQSENAGLSVNMSGGDVTLTVSQFTRNQVFIVASPPSDQNLIVPTNMGAGANTGRRIFQVSNPSTKRITVKTAAGTGGVLPAGTNGVFYMDGTNVTGLIVGAASTRRHDLSFFFPGDLDADSLMVRYVFTQQTHWDVNVPGSQASSVLAPSGGDTSFVIKKNALVIGAIDFADGSSTGTFDHPTATDWVAGDVLSITSDAVDTFGIESPAISIAGYLS